MVNPLTDSQLSKLSETYRSQPCRKCKNGSGSIKCATCDSLYHPSCAAQCKVLASGGYARCCGNRQDDKPTDDESNDNTTPTTSGTSELATGVSQNVSNLIPPPDPEKPASEEYIANLFNAKFSALSSDLQSFTAAVFKRLDTVEADIRALKRDAKISSVNHQELAKDVETVRAEVSSIANAVNVPTLRECIAEIRDQDARKCNLIIHGLAENTSEDHYASNRADGDAVKGVLNFLTGRSELLIKHFRIGKFTHSTKPRPVKIVLNSAESAKTVLDTFYQKSKLTPPPPELHLLSVTKDRTELERKELSLILEEKKQKESNQERSLQVTRRNGRYVLIPSKYTTSNMITNQEMRDRGPPRASGARPREGLDLTDSDRTAKRIRQ